MRFELGGQDFINGAASVKTERTLREVSKAEGMGRELEAVRMKVWCRASTVAIEAALLRIVDEFRRGAAPR